MSRKRRRLFGAVLGLVGVGGVLGFAWFIIAALLPTDPGRVSQRHEPIEDRSSRVLVDGVCGLTESPTQGGCTAVAPTGVREVEVTFPSRLAEKGLHQLRGTLAIPEGIDEARLPGAVIIHGSGPNKRDGLMPGDLLFTFDQPFYLYRDLARWLARHGIVTLRYDKRSSPAYRDVWQFDSQTFRFRDFADDARDALDFLASRPEVDPSALVVVGHSQGGQFAPFVADGDGRVVAVVMLAGTTQSLDVLMTEQLGRQVGARIGQLDFAAALNAWLLPMPWDDCFAAVRDPSASPDAMCMGGATVGAMKEYIELSGRTAEVLRRMHCPVFAVQGTADVNIDPEEIPRLREILAGRDAELHRIRDMGHTLTNTVDPPSPPEIHPELLQRLERFLRSVPRGAAATPGQ